MRVFLDGSFTGARVCENNNNNNWEGGQDEDRMVGLEKKECTPGRNNGNK